MVCGTKVANNRIKRAECAGMVKNEQYFHMIFGLLGASCLKQGQVTPGPVNKIERSLKRQTAQRPSFEILKVVGFLIWK
jgi:hypothetical protein